MADKSCYTCPYCNSGKTSVIRTYGYGPYILRTRKCLACGKRHKTLELELDRVDGDLTLPLPHFKLVELY